MEKSKQLAAAYRAITQEEGCAFLDAAQIVIPSNLDGVHLDETQCKLLGEAVGNIVKQIFLPESEEDFTKE